MLRFIYQKYDIEAQFCIPNSSEWGQYKTWCELRANEVVIGVNAGSPETWPYERVIAFDYQSESGVVLLDHIPSEWMTEAGGEKYNPDALIDHSAPLPHRLQTVWSYHSPN